MALPRGHAAVLGLFVASVLILSVPTSNIASLNSGVITIDEVDELEIGFLEMVDSLNPFIGLNDVSRLFYSLVYDSLTTVDENLDPAPNLALEVYPVPISDPSMQVSGEPYGSVWQYNLTENAFWTDGEPLTADDVVYSINTYTDYYQEVWAFQPYSYFMDYAEKVSNHAVRIHFCDRASGTPTECAFGYHVPILIMPKHIIEGMSATTLSFSWTGVVDNEDTPIVGSGPFKASSSLFEDWQAGNPITLLRNPSTHWIYEYGETVHFDKLTLTFFSDSTAMKAALEAGDIDAASFPPAPYRDMQFDVEGGSLENITLCGTPKITQYFTHIGFCMRPTGDPDLNDARLDVNVRQALAMATNRSYIVDQFYMGLAQEGSTILPPTSGSWHYEPNDAERLDYGLAEAAALLEASGYRDIDSDGVRECTADSWAVQEGYEFEGNPLQLELLVRQEHPEEKQIAMFLQEQWSDIGLAMTYVIVAKEIFSVLTYMYMCDAFLGSWSGDIDPNRQLFCLSSAAYAGWSDNAWSNSSYDANYYMSIQAMEESERRGYVWNCQAIHYQDAPNIVLAYVNQTWAWRTDTFTGWGDWAADPGRSLDNYWGGNPLFFDLQAIVETGTPPVPSFEVSPSNGDVDTLFVMDASDSSDLEDAVSLLEVRWDFEGDGDFDTGWTTNKLINHTYSEKGDYSVRLQVRDSHGNVNATTQAVEVAAGAGMTLALAGVGGVVAGTIVAAVAIYYVSRKRSGIPPPG